MDKDSLRRGLDFLSSMNPDPDIPLPVSDISPPVEAAPPNWQVRLKSEEGKVLLILPSQSETTVSTTWADIWEQFQHRMKAGERFWQPQTVVHLMAQDRLLDARQLQAIADALNESEMQLQRVYTNRRQTAVAAATAGYSVEQQKPLSLLLPSASAQPTPSLIEPLYLQTTVRSGVEIRHTGTVVILGEVNPGGSVIAAGDILIWGRLRGLAHAGAMGNSQCLIMALQMQPTQLRIADYLARAPETPPPQFYPEVAYVTSEGIRITKAVDFSKIVRGNR